MQFFFKAQRLLRHNTFFSYPLMGAKDMQPLLKLKMVSNVECINDEFGKARFCIFDHEDVKLFLKQKMGSDFLKLFLTLTAFQTLNFF